MLNNIVLASANQGKHQELQNQLNPLGIAVKTQSDYGLPSVAETGTTFVENAILKARHAAKATQLAALADDSGLLVDALGGAPGVYSARYSGEHANDASNIQALLAALVDIPEDKRQAYYYCCLVLMRSEADPAPVICEGRWHGRILLKPVGDKGFGYDPIFFVPSHQCSAAELSIGQKNTLSHRGQALAKLIQYFNTSKV